MSIKRLPDNISEDTLRTVLRLHINHFSHQMISIFKGLIAETYEPNVESMSIGIGTFDLDDPYPEIWRYLDGKDKLITSKKSGNFAGHARELGLILVDLPEIDEQAFYKKHYPSNLAEVCVAWISECWWKAGGWDFHVPTDVFVMEGMTPPSIPQLTRAQSS